MAVGSFNWEIVPHKQKETLFVVAILTLICILSFSIRLYAVIRFESVIHEFDPYFNFRTTKFLVEEGIYEFINWFDEMAWYPLGRIVGGTIYPGLMVTAAVIFHVLDFLTIHVDIRNVCVLLAPLFASFTCLTVYEMGREVKDRTTGLLAAGIISVVPGYISRSVAGSYDNEAIAIFCLLLTYTLWIKAVKTGSMKMAAFCALAYFYMVTAWGGYIFIINLIPLYTFVIVLTGRYSHRLYVAYTTFYVLGTLLSMQVFFVGFQPVQSSEHMAAMGVFFFLQAYVFVRYLRSLLQEQFNVIFRTFALALVVLLVVAYVAATVTGYVSPFTGRFYALLDPSYAKNHIPIIASVSEHQPTAWSSFFFDLHILIMLFPAGVYFIFKDLNEANIFVLIYGISSVYFAGVMVRLMLVLAPIACVIGAIAVSSTLQELVSQYKTSEKEEKGQKTKSGSKKPASGFSLRKQGPILIGMGICLMLTLYMLHCRWVTSSAYSSPSIVLAANQWDGSRIIFDDFREAYYWLRMNSAPDAKIMSWWDYGYQLAAMANRTVLVDNNTWNNTHIATVGRAMSGTEEDAYAVMQFLDTDYVLVIFGGVIGYSSDDINKFLWMVRIGGSVYPHIVEKEYFTKQGEYRMDAAGSDTMLNSLMYKLSYYRFGEVMTDQNKPVGWDRVRNCEIGNKNFELNYLEEAYTTEHWLVRIYKVKDLPNRV